MFKENQNIVTEDGITIFTRDDTDMFIVLELECSGEAKVLKLNESRQLDGKRCERDYRWLEPTFENKEQAFAFAEATI